MIRFVFFFLSVCTILAIAAFFLKGQLGLSDVESFDINKFTGAVKENTGRFFSNDAKQNPKFDDEANNEGEQAENKDKTSVYFLKLSDNDKVKFEKMKINVSDNEDRFEKTMKILFSGPDAFEKFTGSYSEIPAATKLLGIKKDGNSYTINISDDFELGGGADSMKARVKQLVTTATQAAGGKDVYLEINGKRAEYVGGEGIMIKQPLAKNLE